jgi:hypothetical protein
VVGVSAQDRFKKRKEEVMARLLNEDPSILNDILEKSPLSDSQLSRAKTSLQRRMLYHEESQKRAKSRTPHSVTAAAVAAVRESLLPESLKRPQKSRESDLLAQPSRAKSSSASHPPGVFKPKSINPFQENWAPPDEHHVYLPDGSIIAIADAFKAPDNDPRGDELVVLSDVEAVETHPKLPKGPEISSDELDLRFDDL